MWATMLKLIWTEQDKISQLAKRVEDDSAKRIREIMADATMARDGLRASYQRLHDLEQKVREAANGEKLPEKPNAQAGKKDSGVGAGPAGAKK